MNLNYPQKFKSSPGVIGRVLLIIASVLSLYLELVPKPGVFFDDDFAHPSAALHGA